LKIWLGLLTISAPFVRRLHALQFDFAQLESSPVFFFRPQFENACLQQPFGQARR
jgi:hypothetical protein